MTETITWEQIPEHLVKVLKEKGIKLTDLSTYCSDLHVGCPDHETACQILHGGIWKASSSIFLAQKGSDMDHYPACVEIAFAAMAYDFKQKHPNHVQTDMEL